MILIFMKLAPYFRLHLAETCKELAWLAMTNDLLLCDPTTSILLEGVKLRSIQRGRSIKLNSNLSPKSFSGMALPPGPGRSAWNILT